jgi:hypothetical protein
VPGIHNLESSWPGRFVLRKVIVNITI